MRQVSEKIEGRVLKNLSQESSRTESRILGALSKLDGFLLNPHVRTLTSTVLGSFWKKDVKNQEPTEDRSQKDPISRSNSLLVGPATQLTQTRERPLTPCYLAPPTQKNAMAREGGGIYGIHDTIYKLLMNSNRMPYHVAAICLI